MHSPQEFLNRVHKTYPANDAHNPNVEVTLFYPPIRGRCCGGHFSGHPSKEPDPIIFKIPKGTRLSVYDWIGRKEMQFYGVDRDVDPTRLAGCVYDGSAMISEEAVLNGCAYVAREGSLISHVFVPRGLKISNCVYFTTKTEVIECLDLAPNTALIVQMDTWSLIDGVLCCKTPGWNCVVLL